MTLQNLLQTFRTYWYVAVIFVAVIALACLMWLNGRVDKSQFIDTHEGPEGSQFTLSTPRTSITGEVIAIFQDQSGIRLNGKAEVVGSEGNESRVRITVPSGICGPAAFGTRENVRVILANEGGKPAPGAPSPNFVVLCGAIK